MEDQQIGWIAAIIIGGIAGWLGYLIAGFIGAAILIFIARMISGARATGPRLT